MEKGLFLFILSGLTALLTGCSTPAPNPAPAPAPAVPAEPPIPITLLVEMQSRVDNITQAGGLTALGTAESKSLNLALNMAKKNGRHELARALKARIEVLATAFSEETAIPYDSLLLTGFTNAARMITKQQIAGSIAKEQRYDQVGDTFTAYAIMELDPKIIVEQLAREPDLYPRLQGSKTFEVLNQQIKSYEAFTTP